MPRKAQGRPQVVALGGVVVDDVEDDLDVRLVQRLDQRLELLHLLTGRVGERVAVVRGEEADRVVAPVVREVLLDEGRVVDELVHGHQLDRGDAERRQVLDDGRVGHAHVGAAELLGDVRVLHGQALDVGLVDDALVVLVIGRTVEAPVEVGVDDNRRHRVPERVLVVEAVGVTEVVGEEGLAAVDLPVDRLGVGVEQELDGVAAVAGGGVVRTVHAVAVALAGLHVREVDVPDVGVDLGQLDARLGVVVLEQAQLDAIGGLREQREVRAGAVELGAERVGLAGVDLAGVGLHGAESRRGRTNGTGRAGSDAAGKTGVDGAGHCHHSRRAARK